MPLKFYILNRNIIKQNIDRTVFYHMEHFFPDITVNLKITAHWNSL